MLEHLDEDKVTSISELNIQQFGEFLHKRLVVNMPATEQNLSHAFV